MGCLHFADGFFCYAEPLCLLNGQINKQITNMDHIANIFNFSAKLNLLEDALQHRNKAVALTEGQKAWAPSSSSDDLSCIPSKDKLNGAVRGDY